MFKKREAKRSKKVRTDTQDPESGDHGVVQYVLALLDLCSNQHIVDFTTLTYRISLVTITIQRHGI